MKDQTVIHLFEKCARELPDHIAVKELSQAVSYRDFNGYVNQLANILHQLKVGEGKIVNVMLSLSKNMVASMLAIFKAGGIYLPMNRSFSEKRMQEVFEKTCHGIFITDSSEETFLSEQFAASQIREGAMIVLQDQGAFKIIDLAKKHVREDHLENYSNQNPDFGVTPEQENYIYFTSGSTGEAKAILGCHKSLYNYIQWVIREFKINADHRVGHLSQSTFDASLKDVFMALGSGATLCIPEEKTKENIYKLLEWMQHEDVSIIQTVPSLFRVMLKAISDVPHTYNFPALKHIMLDGEVLYEKDVMNWRTLVGDKTELVNLYGTTESTILDTFHRIDKISGNGAQGIHVGKPIDNTFVLIINGNNKLCRIGEIGEVYIKTPYLTKGYYNNRTLTQIAFVQNPLVTDKPDIVYRTGDLGRYLKDRNVEILGRKDKQVKVNGVRIEINEIEKATLDIKGIQEVAVIVHTNKESNLSDLICYFVSDAPTPAPHIKSALQKKLNANHLPSHFIQLDAFPLNSNGKLDKKALPLPESLLLDHDYEACEGEVEVALEGIWKEVLGRERIGRNAAFLSIGGQSLKAIQVVSRIYKIFQVNVSIRDVFEHQTIKEFSLHIASLNKTSYQDISTVEEQELYPVSDAQKRLWILSQTPEGNIAYNIGGLFTLEGNFDKRAFEGAFHALLSRHESLRTAIVEHNGALYQKINLFEPVEIELLDLSYENNKHEKVKQLAHQQATIPFDLAKGNLIKVKLFKLGESSYQLALTLHHIISDAWSMRLLIRELLTAYNALSQGRSLHLQPLRVQYKDYQAWQTNQIANHRQTSDKDYWLKKLSGKPERLVLPTELQRPPIKTYNGQRFKIEFSDQVYNRFAAFCQKNDITLFTFLTAVLKALFHRYTTQKDIVIGTTLAGRDHRDLEDQIGFYVNTLVLRTQIEKDETFLAFIHKVKDTLLSAHEHKAYPFENLLDDLGINRDLSHSPLFDVLVELINVDFEMGTTPDMRGVSVYNNDLEHVVSKFDLTFSFKQAAGLSLNVEFNSDIYTREFVESIGSHFKNLASLVIEKPELSLEAYSYLNDNEIREQLEIGFYKQAIYRASFIEAFEMASEVHATSVAVQLNDNICTYDQLNASANQLANYLLEEYDIKPGDRVVILSDHTPEMVMGMIGILKSGAAFIPIDPGYPTERIKKILEAVKPKVLLIDSYRLLPITEIYNGNLFTLDLQLHELQTEVKNASVVQSAETPAYIIFTSGSTGVPKGVVVSQASFMNYLSWANEYYFKKTSSHTFGLFTSLSFDLSLTALFTTLLRGDKLVLFNTLEIDKVLIQAFSGKHEINTLKITPSHILMLRELPLDASSIKTLIVGGEALKAEHIQILNDLNFKGDLYNEYGPTETTVGCMIKYVQHASDVKSIGKPIANTQVLILDNNLNLLPKGHSGELCISGTGVAQGYFNDPALTSEKFTDVSFDGEHFKIYKTGDRGRWMSNDEIEFLGRTDDQIKLRGYRIEPSEIEAHLTSHPPVHSAKVKTVTIAGDQQLVAYYIPVGETDPDDLRDFVAKSLPAYMIPACFVEMKSFPYTINGKVDMDALPIPQLGDLKSSYVPATNDIELALVGLWEEVLGKKKIGVTDNFFDLGGHSLKATQIAHKVRTKLNVDLQLKDIFTHPTIRGISRAITEFNPNTHASFPIIEEQDYYAVSHAQERMWILHQLEEQKAAYNIPSRYVFNGDLSIPNLTKAFDILITRYESLRTSFITVGGKPKQRISSKINGDAIIKIKDVSYLSGRENEIREIVKEETMAPFDLESAPLIRLILLRLNADEHVLLFNIHHIISDGWSMEILIKEFLLIYNGLKESKTIVLPRLTSQYKEFSSWQNAQLQANDESKARHYWMNQFKGEIPVLNLPVDFSRPALKTFRGGSVAAQVGETLTQDLKSVAREHEVSLFVLLLSSVKSFLYKYTNQSEIIIGTPVAGRDHADLENQVGLFVNTLALYTSFDPSHSFIELLRNVGRNSLNAFEHQQYPFDKLVDELDLVRDMSRSPLFDVFVVVNYATNYDDQNGHALQGVSVSGYAHDTSISKFDLQFTFSILERDIHISLGYNSDIFKEERVAAMLAHFKELLASITRYFNEPVKKLSILTQEEKAQLLFSFNNTFRLFDKTVSITRLFEQRVKETPGAIVLRYNEISFTYDQINKQTNQLAHYLINDRRVSPGEFVGLITGRTPSLLIGLLAILKAGAAYVTFDPEYPTDRINYILHDTDLKVIVAENETLSKLVDSGDREIIILDNIADDLKKQNVTNNGIEIQPGDPAYVIYTSGSTGKPKGVVIVHESVNAFLGWASEEFKQSNFDLVYATTSYCFDLSVFELFYPLTVGKAVRIVENGLAIPKFIHVDNNVLLNTVPSVIKALIEDKMDFSHVEVLNMAGEPIPLYIKTTLENSIPEIRNLYGPSEDTTYSTCYRFNTEDKKITIGRPISNTSIYVVDEEMNLLPIGVPGELCIAGSGLAKGYLNQMELTADKFVRNPFGSGEWLYKTGDYAQWQGDGQLDFLGRRDNQIKLRGYRIELGEVENAISSHPSVNDALVVMKENSSGVKHLVAYFTATDIFEMRALKVYLADKLPAYMIPAYLVCLKAFPLTPNGKIDRKQLPNPFESAEATTAVPAGNALEQGLIDIWKAVLDTGDIGIHDNFFAIGGDSIKALQIAARAHAQGFKLEVRNILKSPTIEQLATLLKPVETADQKAVLGLVPLTPIQAAFFEDDPGNVNHYNQSVMFFQADRFDKACVGEAITRLVEHHDMLRAQFHYHEGIWSQEIQTDKKLVYDAVEQGSVDREKFIAEMVEQAQSSLDLEKGVIVRVVLLRCDDGDRLLMVIHHLVVDGVSWRILLEDFNTLYIAFIKGDTHKKLPQKTTSFKDWSIKLREVANSKAFRKEVSYWNMVHTQTINTIPVDHQGGLNLVRDSKTDTFWLDDKYTNLLLKKVHQAYHTEVTDILIASIGLGLRSAFGLETVNLNLEGHGRENILDHVEISRTVGWFTSVYPVSLNLLHASQPGRHIKEIKEQLHKVPNKGIGYGMWRHLIKRNDGIQFSNVPQILFNYLGQFDSDIKRSGLTMASESVGNAVDPNRKRKYLLEINSAIIEGKLQLSVVYSNKQYEKNTIAGLLSDIKTSLAGIIDWCALKEVSERTPSDLTFSDLSIEDVDRITKRYPVEDIYPLSPMQEGLFFHILMDKNSSYFEQLSYSLSGDLNVEVVQRSLNELFKRHHILRAAIFQEESGNPLQLIFTERKIDFHFEDISDQNDLDQQQFVEQFKEKDKSRSFDLLKDTLLRVAIIKQGAQRFECIWSYHHILLDGWCMSVLFTEYFEIYSCLNQNKPYSLPEVKPYKNYIAWLSKRDHEASKKYWFEYLKGYQEKASIPSVNTIRRPKDEYAQEELFFEIAADKTNQLKAIAKEYQITINTLFHTVWGVLLGKYAGRKDVVFGEVVSGRPAEVEGIEKMIGLFINTVPIRVSFDESNSFLDLLKTIHQTSIEREPHHYSPLVDIQAVSVLKNDLFDHILMLGNYPVFAPVDENDKQHSEQGMQVSNVQIFEQVSYDLNIGIGIGEKVLIKFNFNAHVYSKDYLKALTGHFELLIDQIIHNINIPIADLELMSSAERIQYLIDLTNTTRVSADLDLPLHRLFEKQVKETPRATALVYKGQSWTYESLNVKANALAHYLRNTYNVQPDDRLGLLVDRSESMIVGILGILKAGGAYVPVDPSYPIERIALILKDADIKCLLTESNAMFDVGSVYQGELFALDIQLETLEEDITDLPDTATSMHLAYIMYTSGSSGKPKGVAVEHRSVARLVKDTNYMKLNGHHKVLQLSNFAFDGSVFDIFGTLLNGSCLHLIGKDVLLSNEKLIDYIHEHAINITFITTALFNNLVELSPECISNFDHIYFGGEEASLSHIRKALHYRKQPDSIVHVYGPTENTTFSTFHVITALPELQVSVPIGKPISNTTAYILDEGLKPVPCGVIGEICLGGTGLARGYWMNESLTNQKFIWHSFDGKNKERLYLTGDVGRFLPDGSIDFKGRKDNQVKIRGNRVELGEIENIMLRHDDIEQAHLVIKDVPKVGKQLVAYYTGNMSDVKAFRSFMEKYLPVVMVPSYFIKLESMPFNANGKIDNNALPDPGHGLNKSDQYLAPRTEIEKALVRIWEGILKKSPIGIKDNFFLTGGDSILAIRLVSALNKELHLNVEVKDIFHCLDIMTLADAFEGRKVKDESVNKNKALQAIEDLKHKVLSDVRWSKLLPEDFCDFFPASDIQKGMLYYSTRHSDDSLGMYHDQIFYQFEDIDFDYHLFEDAFYKLVEKHEILRTSFDFENFPEEIQIVHDADSCDQDIDLINISHLSEKLKKKYLTEYFRSDRKKPFDITKPGLWRLRLFQLSDHDYGILLIIHHAIIDGWSEASLRTELSNIYYALKANKPISIQKLKASYKDFVIAQLQHKGSEQYSSFWKTQLKGYQRSSLPFHKKIGSDGNKQYETVQTLTSISSEITDSLLHLSEKLNVPVKSIFVAAFAYFIKITTGQNDVTFGLVSNGRPEVEDGDKIIGCFLNTVPFRVAIEHQEPVSRFIDRVNTRESELKQFDKLPLLEIATAIGENTSAGNPIFDLIFNYLDLHIVDDMHERAQGKPAIVQSYVKTNTHFDFTVNRIGNVFHLHLIYESQVFAAEDVQRIFDYYMSILKSFIQDEKLVAGNILHGYEKDVLINEFNDTRTAYPSDKGIAELFSELVNMYGNNKALVSGGQSLTYTELDEQSTRFASYLISNGIQRDDLVGIKLKKSFLNIVAVLGTIKAGAAYVPLPVASDNERLRYMIADLNPKLLLINSDDIFRVDDYQGAVLKADQIEDILEEINDDAHIKLPVNRPSDLAYIMYTSGSTGKPKGVMVEHQGVVRLVKNTNYIELNAESKLLQNGSMAFDASTFEIWGMLLNGGTLYLAEEEEMIETRKFQKLLLEYDIDILWITTAWFHQVVEEDITTFRNLKKILVGGERLSKKHIREFKRHYPDIDICNMYGPTENTTFSTFHLIDEIPEGDITIPIGKPIANTTVYIFDKDRELSPIGVIGEIAVGGDGLSRGYWNKPDLTSSKFISNPFHPNEKLYCSGDYGRWLKDGTIEFIGRVDNQVKVRGFRIELGEVETVLEKLEGVEKAVVIAVDGVDQTKQLVAYYSLQKEMDQGKIRQMLKKQLPDYMVPGNFIRVKEFPLNVNGKVDRNKLITMNDEQVENKLHTAPRNDVEKQLAEIWQTILGVERVSMDDNFFEIGGHSLTATRMLTKVHKEMDAEINIRQLFIAPTLEKLALEIAATRWGMRSMKTEDEVVYKDIII